MVTISETIGQGADVRERRFKEAGYPEDSKGKCPFYDHILIGDTIYTYQGNGAWTSAPMPDTSRNENKDAFLGLDDVLRQLVTLERVRSNGSVVRGFTRGSTIKNVVVFDSEGRLIEYRLLGLLAVTLEWTYGIDVVPIDPPF